MLSLQVIIASTRKNRQGPPVAQWAFEQAQRHGKFQVELIDLAEVNLPLLDEPNHPRLRQYEHEHTKAWSRTVERADAFVFVTPEYDYGSPASLINALQYLQREWAYKPVAFVSYGGVSGGTRSVQMTKQIVTSLKMMPMVEAVNLPFFAQHIDKETRLFAPPTVQDDAARVMLDETLRWAEALGVLRVKA
jgi:NAD(P)H-dependent FMN reductase